MAGTHSSKPIPKADIEVCQRLFDNHPEDVISPIKSAADTLGWLEELFRTIECEALNERNSYRIKHLAEMGAYLASDMSNLMGCQYETMVDRLRNTGDVPVKGGAA